jgi:hypothetical protein
VERRKIRSGSSAAKAREVGHIANASISKIKRLQLSHELGDWDVMDVSVGEADPM